MFRIRSRKVDRSRTFLFFVIFPVLRKYAFYYVVETFICVRQYMSAYLNLKEKEHGGDKLIWSRFEDALSVSPLTVTVSVSGQRLHFRRPSPPFLLFCAKTRSFSVYSIFSPGFMVSTFLLVSVCSRSSIQQQINHDIHYVCSLAELVIKYTTHDMVFPCRPTVFTKGSCYSIYDCPTVVCSCDELSY